MKKCFSFIFLCMMFHSVMAWDSKEHRVIAQIAYDNLTQQAKMNLTELLVNNNNQRYLAHELQMASTWPDYIKNKKNIHTFDSWHYISLPFSMDETPLPPVPKSNVVSAIEQAKEILTNPNASLSDKRLYTKLLIHFMGDIHQPLHCATQVSKKFPFGDRGGNFYLINDLQYQNLHEFWDDAGGLLTNYFPYQKLHDYEIKAVAHSIEEQYPEFSFAHQTDLLNPTAIAKESLMVAETSAYQIAIGTIPSTDYIKKSQIISAKQMALAGYRLAHQLNLIFGGNQPLARN